MLKFLVLARYPNSIKLVKIPTVGDVKAKVTVPRLRARVKVIQ